MNGGVTQGTGLVFLRLVVEGRGGGRARVNVEGVTLEAHQIDLTAFEKTRVRGAVRGVAGGAAFGLYDGVFVDKRPGLFGVAFEADGVLRSRGAQLAIEEPAVRIVAIATLHEPFVYAVMKCAAELLFGFEVAGVTKLRLFLLHQELGFFRVVRIVAIRAANVVLEVRGASEIAVLLTVLVAAQATLADLLC